MNKSAIIIPARIDSTRLPRKMLLNKTGKPLMQHTWENCMKSNADCVYIASSDKEILDSASSFGANTIETINCKCGTQRVFEASKSLDLKFIINVQGDNPQASPCTINKIISSLEHHSYVSACHSCESSENEVKVLIDSKGFAKWFSRKHYIHAGVYGFRKDALKKFSYLSDTEDGKLESLEQLRLLENCEKIYMVQCTKTIDINSQDDYSKFVNDFKLTQ